MTCHPGAPAGCSHRRWTSPSSSTGRHPASSGCASWSPSTARPRPTPPRRRSAGPGATGTASGPTTTTRRRGPARWRSTSAATAGAACRGRSGWRHVPTRWTARADDLPDVDLQRALRALPVRQREAVVLHDWADLDIAGCAAVMGVSPGSVKQHLARVRRRRGGRPHHPRRRRERGGPGDHDGPADRSGGPGRVRRCGRRRPAGRRGGRPAGRAARSTAVRLRRPPGVGLRSPADPAGRGPRPSWRPPSCGPSRRRR